MNGGLTYLIGRFESFADGRHHFILISLIGSVLSSLALVFSYYFIWAAINEGFSGCDIDRMTGFGLWALGTALLSVLIYIISLFFSHYSAFRIAKNLKKILIRHILSLPPDSFDQDGSGAFHRTVQDSVESTHLFIAHLLPDMASTYALPIAIAVMLFCFDWRLGLASLIPMAMGAAIVFLLMSRPSMRDSMSRWQSSMAEVNSKTVEYVRGMPVVKVFQQSIDSFHDLKGSIERYAGFCQDYTREARAPLSCFFVLINGCCTFIIAAAFILIEYVNGGTVTADLAVNVIFYIIFSSVITSFMMKIIFLPDQSYKAREALQRIDSMLSMAPLEEPSQPVFPKEFSISFRDVSFSYAGSGSMAVSGIDLDMPSGTVTALIGASGSGKSTLAGLASRMWDPQEGSVSIGGLDLREIGSANLQRIESCVFQRNNLIRGTLRDNVMLGRPEATPEQLNDALESAQCADIVSRMPQGLDTPVGPDGVHLSGGEIQRISIARAILRDSPIVLLDEATAFIDPDNESLIRKALGKLMAGRTVIMIAHRITAVRDADLICVMDGGRIVERGRHDDLISAGVVYKRMWNEYHSSLKWNLGRARP